MSDARNELIEYIRDNEAAGKTTIKDMVYGTSLTESTVVSYMYELNRGQFFKIGKKIRVGGRPQNIWGLVPRINPLIIDERGVATVTAVTEVTAVTLVTTTLPPPDFHVEERGWKDYYPKEDRHIMDGKSTVSHVLCWDVGQQLIMAIVRDEKGRFYAKTMSLHEFAPTLTNYNPVFWLRAHARLIIERDGELIVRPDIEFLKGAVSHADFTTKGKRDSDEGVGGPSHKSPAAVVPAGKSVEGNTTSRPDPPD